MAGVVGPHRARSGRPRPRSGRARAPPKVGGPLTSAPLAVGDRYQFVHGDKRVAAGRPGLIKRTAAPRSRVLRNTVGVTGTCIAGYRPCLGRRQHFQEQAGRQGWGFVRSQQTLPSKPGWPARGGLAWESAGREIRPWARARAGVSAGGFRSGISAWGFEGGGARVRASPECRPIRAWTRMAV